MRALSKLSTMKPLHCVVLLAAVISTVAADEQFRSDYDYHFHAQGWLKFHNTPTDWRSAELQCFHEGAVLASPIDDDVKDAMTSIMENRGAVVVHTGVHNRHNNALYTSIEGVLLSDMPVKKNYLAFEEYVTTPHSMRFYQHGDISMSSFNDRLPYICYKKKKIEVKQPVCSTVHKYYRYDTWTGHCYKLHNIAASWQSGYMTCVNEGGYLAIINSNEEANVLKQLFAQYPAGKIIGADNNHVVNIGYLDWYKNENWRTIHGESLQDAGYAGWHLGKPDNLFYKGEDPDCGSMSREGGLDDNYCKLPSAFICEKAPENIISFTVF